MAKYKRPMQPKLQDYYITSKVRKMWEGLVPGKLVAISKDDVVIKIVNSSDDAFIYIHNHQGQSVPWACAYEGWSVKN
jgi:hypothetical protein